MTAGSTRDVNCVTTSVAHAPVAAAPVAAPMSAASDSPQSPDDAPRRSTSDPAERRVDQVRIRLAVDEIARRVISSSGLLDSCAKAAQAALADLEALQDEAQQAQRMLVALRARLLTLDQRSNALTWAALGTHHGEDPRAKLAKLAQAVQMQTLHCHQLAERLAMQEHSHGPRVQSMRQGLDAIALRVERGLRESQQVMMLTRKIDDALASAGGDAQGAAAELDGTRR